MRWPQSMRQREHRLKRERDLVAALEDGLYDREALLDRVWSDVGPELRIAAHVTMQTNLEKLDLEGRLPDDFETEGRKSWQHRRPNCLLEKGGVALNSRSISAAAGLGVPSASKRPLRENGGVGSGFPPVHSGRTQ